MLVSSRERGAGARESASPGEQKPVAGRAGTVSGLPREHVSEIQRMRILAAMAEVASERGAGSVTVAHVVARAGVSRRTFYDLFADREKCFLAAFEEAIGRMSRLVVEAYEHASTWREQMRAGLWALLVFLDEEPALARLCVVESLAAGPRVLERRATVVRALVRGVDEGREANATGTGPVARTSTRKASQLPPLTAEGVVGAVLSVIHTRLSEPGAKPLTSLLGELMSVIVMPYLGQAAAQKELRRQAPKLNAKTTPATRDPLDGLDMRITYRTVRVLMTIASNPGASNRKIATEAGIGDQGQVSKLLARLEHLGLIHNTGIGPAKGAPNAWELTARGEQVQQAITVQTIRGA